MKKLQPQTITELQRLHQQAQRLTTKSPKHAQLAVFLAGYLKAARVTL